MEGRKVEFSRRHIKNFNPPSGKLEIRVVYKKLDNGEMVDSWLPYNTVREREIFNEGVMIGIYQEKNKDKTS